jgi:hypothetical protein
VKVKILYSDSLSLHSAPIRMQTHDRKPCPPVQIFSSPSRLHMKVL